MLRTIPATRAFRLSYRLIAITAFVTVTILASRLTIEIGLVPFTLQPLAVLLAGMVLGARDGLLSQAVYVALIAAGLPFDARGLGTTALFGPTGGYLIGFIAAAGMVGWLVERGANRVWQRWLAGIVGVIIIYAFGLFFLLAHTGMDFGKAWSAGAAPFIIPDLTKALIAAALTEGGRAFLLRRN